ncbi:hypothetical protein HMI01_19790 [Halolactibacillus miurensis]|uniref:Uncharacterized protein n=1 Tax=Halolactibacillus miurensis TaxID=306541 RepID=A0A1I6T380_9BACI|nr:hypothetical protein HMI01_19790 [Halolactibacillus miurensis]SFS83712.1 hypothetical protein SAMN05421668_11235 [Halolactibacillus miurensis]
MFQPHAHFSLCHIFIVYWFLFIRLYLDVIPLSKNNAKMSTENYQKTFHFFGTSTIQL